MQRVLAHPHTGTVHQSHRFRPTQVNMGQTIIHFKRAIPGLKGGRRASQNPERGQRRNITPAIPFVKIEGAVVTHQEDKIRRLKTGPQRRQRIKTAIRAKFVFNAGRQDMRFMSQHHLTGRQPRG